jgi:transposase
VEARVQALNQLRSNLELALPGSVGLFARPNSKITLAFLTRFPTADKVVWLSPRRLQAWLASVGYSGGVTAETLFERLSQAAPGLTGAEGAARGRVTLGLVRMVEALNAEIEQVDDDISQLFRRHPDQHIFSSLPRSGMVRAASLLAEIGDCRERFPSDDALAALAGAVALDAAVRQARADRVPVVLQQKLRAAVMDFANGSRAADPWAADVYRRAIARGCRHPHAIRILAHAWIRVVWRCWQDGQAFDPARHRGRQTLAA